MDNGDYSILTEKTLEKGLEYNLKSFNVYGPAYCCEDSSFVGEKLIENKVFPTYYRRALFNSIMQDKLDLAKQLLMF